MKPCTYVDWRAGWMEQQTMKAEEVRVGDRVYDADFHAPNKWCVVREVHEALGSIAIRLSHVTILKNPQEEVAVQRG